MLKYFLEIKNRFILLWVTWLSTILTTYIYKEVLLFVLIQSNVSIHENNFSAIFYFIFTDVTEILYIYLKLVTFLSAQTLYVFLVYHFYLFFIPALFQVEYSYLKLYLQFFVCFWIASAFLTYFFLIPLMWDFFLSFQYSVLVNSFNLQFEAKLKEYLCFYISLYYFSFFYCQFLTLFGILWSFSKFDIKTIKKCRKLFYYIFICLSTLISPPEILSQILLSFALVLIYEVLFLISLLKANILITQ